MDAVSLVIIALLAISEVLALSKKVKANSIFQMLVGILSALKPKKELSE